MTSGIDDAKTRITRNLVKIRGDGELMGIGAMLNLVGSYHPVPDAVCETMATDGSKVYYNESFVDAISDPEIRYVLLHEAMHIAYGHHLRLEDRRKDVANIAMDHIINNQLDGSSAAQRGFIDRPWKDQTPCDPKYADQDKWNFERVYLDILKDYPEQQQQQCSGDGKQGGGRPDGMGDFKAPGEVWPSDAMANPEALQQEQDRIKEALAQGKFTEKGWSPDGGTDSLLGGISQGDDDKVRGWNFMSELMNQIYSYHRTWARPSLALSDVGYFPARVMEKGNLHVVIDVSGSVSNEELKIYLSNSRAICEQIGIGKVKVAYVDSRIRNGRHGEVWEEFDVATGEEIEFEIPGRGGTDFTPIFEWIEEELEDVQCLVYFTDGWGGCRAPEPDFPVIWATTDGPPRWWGESGREDWESAGWGYVAEIEPVSY